jgi:hypothetical protein
MFYIKSGRDVGNGTAHAAAVKGDNPPLFVGTNQFVSSALMLMLPLIDAPISEIALSL